MRRHADGRCRRDADEVVTFDSRHRPPIASSLDLFVFQDFPGVSRPGTPVALLRAE
jgi:hypothetical protein